MIHHVGHDQQVVVKGAGWLLLVALGGRDGVDLHSCRQLLPGLRVFGSQVFDEWQLNREAPVPEAAMMRTDVSDRCERM